MSLRRWRDIKLGTKGLIVVAAPAAATVLVACAAYLIGSLADKAASQANEAIEASSTVQELKTNEVDESASIRGYLIAGDERLAARIRNSFAEFDGTSKKLARLFASDNSQQQRLQAIAGLQRRRIETILEAVTQFRAGALSRESGRDEVIAAERDRAEMEATIDTMLAEEKRILEGRAADARKLRSRLSAAIGICAIGGVLGGVMISMLFASGITSRIEKLSEKVARLATGTPLDNYPAGTDEIGVLNDGVMRTAEILRTKTRALENALQGIAQADASGLLISFNRACAALLGLEESAGPVQILSAVQAEDRSRVEEAIGAMRETGRCEVEANIRRTDESTTDVLMMFLPLSERDPKGGYHIFIRDISLQRKAEEALIQARDAALASSRAKTDFLAKISHDIRTPLNAILGSADLLSQTRLDADQSDYVKMFQRNCRRLVALINDFLDFSRIEAGAVRVDRRDFRLRQIVDDVARTFHESASRKGIGMSAQIGADIPDALTGDPLRIQQVLTNLISNAVKFTQEGRVDISVAAESSNGVDFLRFEIADTGPGISPVDQESIFAPFVQLANAHAAAQTAGSGLGLAICRELVQLLGGEIRVESELGAGSRFYFTVPLERTQAKSASAAKRLRRPAERTLRPLSILIAEDEEDNRALLRHYLRKQPLEIQFADNGQQAVNAVTDGKNLDLILMDMDMPVMDGHAAIRKIREWEAASSQCAAPIVALSARAIAEEVRACLDEGCVAHIAKPVSQTTLIETIECYSRESLHRDRIEASNAVKALAPGYLGSKHRQIEEAFGHLYSGNFDPIRRFGHNLKGTGRGYGFPEIEEAGRQIEKSAEEANEAEIARQLHALSRAVSGASQAMDRIVAS